MNKIFAIILTIFTLIASCKSEKKKSDEISKPENNIQLSQNDSLKYSLNSNKQFLKDSLLKENNGIIENYFLLYQTDTCGVLTHKNSKLKAEFKGLKILKGIRTNKQQDTVFLMPSFNYCDDGQSYCFFDKTLPRLFIDSYCCHPDNLFVCSDIDEDGINEIGIFYSSCASRYKSLRIYSLKQNQWTEIGTSTFDILTQDPTKVKFETLVKKVSKNKFEICNFDDGEASWEIITMK